MAQSRHWAIGLGENRLHRCTPLHANSPQQANLWILTFPHCRPRLVRGGWSGPAGSRVRAEAAACCRLHLQQSQAEASSLGLHAPPTGAFVTCEPPRLGAPGPTNPRPTLAQKTASSSIHHPSSIQPQQQTPPRKTPTPGSLFTQELWGVTQPVHLGAATYFSRHGELSTRSFWVPLSAQTAASHLSPHLAILLSSQLQPAPRHSDESGLRHRAGPFSSIPTTTSHRNFFFVFARRRHWILGSTCKHWTVIASTMNVLLSPQPPVLPHQHENPRLSPQRPGRFNPVSGGCSIPALRWPWRNRISHGRR